PRRGARDRGPLAALHLLGRAALEPLHAVARLPPPPRVDQRRAGGARAGRLLPRRGGAPRSRPAEPARPRRARAGTRVLPLAAGGGNARTADVARGAGALARPLSRFSSRRPSGRRGLGATIACRFTGSPGRKGSGRG